MVDLSFGKRCLEIQQQGLALWNDAKWFQNEIRHIQNHVIHVENSEKNCMEQDMLKNNMVFLAA